MKLYGIILESGLLPILEVLGVLAVLLLGYLTIDFVVFELRQRTPKREKGPSKVAEFHARMNAFREARAKAKVRDEKAYEARHSFFEQPYVGGFNSDTGELIVRGLTFEGSKARAYHELMDELADTAIFENSEVL